MRPKRTVTFQGDPAGMPDTAAVDAAFATAFGISQDDPGVSAISAVDMDSSKTTVLGPKKEGSALT